MGVGVPSPRAARTKPRGREEARRGSGSTLRACHPKSCRKAEKGAHARAAKATKHPGRSRPLIRAALTTMMLTMTSTDEQTVSAAKKFGLATRATCTQPCHHVSSNLTHLPHLRAKKCGVADRRSTRGKTPCLLSAHPVLNHQ